MSMDAPVPVERARDLPLLTAIRFFFAIWVVFHHFGFWTLPQGTLSDVVQHLIRPSSIRVKFFFIFSGFILAHVHGRIHPAKAFDFMLSRLSRLYPLYAVSLVLSLPLLVGGFQERIAHRGPLAGSLIATFATFLSILLQQSWFPSTALFWNGVAWSLCVDVFFYLAFPFLMPWFLRQSRRRLWSFLLAGILWELGRTALEARFPSLLWRFNPILRLPDLVSGICLYLLANGSKRPLWLAPVFLAGLLLGVVLPTSKFAMWTAVQLCTLGLIWSLSTSDLPRWSRKAVAFGASLGKTSYAIFLLHVPVNHIWTLAAGGWDSSMFGPYFATLLVLSWIALKTVEEPLRNPCRRLLERLFGRFRPAAAAE